MKIIILRLSSNNYPYGHNFDYTNNMYEETLEFASATKQYIR